MASLIMSQTIMAIVMFVLSLMISLALFNGLFRERRGLRIAINISFLFVLIAIGVIVAMLYQR